MSAKTKIEWCDSTWNPVVGCSKVSAGCANCYAERMVNRFPDLTGVHRYSDQTGERYCDGLGWDGRAHFMPHKLEQPLHWKKPRKIFVCSMGDLFHESIKNEQIAAVFGVMAACPQHTFMVLTKRVDRAIEWFMAIEQNEEPEVFCGREAIINLHWIGFDYGCGSAFESYIWPLPNVWFGVSIEDQKSVSRLDVLKDIPAAKRYVSYEPAIELALFDNNLSWLDLVIMGAETGPGKRPMNLDWARSTRDRCKATNTPFFFKKDSDGNHTLDGVVHEE